MLFDDPRRQPHSNSTTDGQCQRGQPRPATCREHSHKENPTNPVRPPSSAASTKSDKSHTTPRLFGYRSHAVWQTAHQSYQIHQPPKPPAGGISNNYPRPAGHCGGAGGCRLGPDSAQISTLPAGIQVVAQRNSGRDVQSDDFVVSIWSRCFDQRAYKRLGNDQNRLADPQVANDDVGEIWQNRDHVSQTFGERATADVGVTRVGVLAEPTALLPIGGGGVSCCAARP